MKESQIRSLMRAVARWVPEYTGPIIRGLSDRIESLESREQQLEARVERLAAAQQRETGSFRRVS